MPPKQNGYLRSYFCTVKLVYEWPVGHEKVTIIGRGPLYGGQNKWGKALSELTEVAFMERWLSFRVAIIDRFYCTHIIMSKLCRNPVFAHCI